MKSISIQCPACFGRYDKDITSRFLTCDYCGTRFALSEEELGELGFYGDEEEEYDEYDEYAYDEDDNIIDIARNEIDDFLCRVDRDNFESSGKILYGLGIDENEEEVLLIHDDTLFKSGKNGFAITSAGFYCRDMGDRNSHYMSWEDFAHSRYEPALDSSYIYVDGTSVAYFTGGGDDINTLLDLYCTLNTHATNLLA